MNTVLDDNKKLCLMSGEIIQLSPTTNLIFEVMDLEAASPATVSRCGMIYIEPASLGWEPIVEAWLKCLPAFLSSEIKALLKRFIYFFTQPCLNAVKYTSKTICPFLEMNLVNSMLNFIECYFDQIQEVKNSKKNSEFMSKLVEGVFIFSLTWSICGMSTDVGQVTLSEFVKKLIEGTYSNDDLKAIYIDLKDINDRPKFKMPIPRQSSIYDIKLEVSEVFQLFFPKYS